MGSVYVAEHSLLGRTAAIKVLRPEMSAKHDVVSRFFNEARASASIADPGIVQVFDFGYHTDGSAYLVMELLEGETLDTRLHRMGCLAPAEALRLVGQAAQSLHAAHMRGIVHRDLKPDNLFVVRDPAVPGGERTKILDFGIAKLGDDAPRHLKTQTGAVMGTPMFMSPEQCRGLSTIDYRTDIYSLGCVLYVALTGRFVFDGEGVGDILFAHMSIPPPVASQTVPSLPPAVDEIIRRCLAKRPSERFASMIELARALSAVDGVLTRADFSWAMLAPTTAQGSRNAGQSITISDTNGQSTSSTKAATISRSLSIGVIAVITALVAIIAVQWGRAAPGEPAVARPPRDLALDAMVVPIDAAHDAMELAPSDASVDAQPADATRPALAVPSTSTPNPVQRKKGNHREPRTPTDVDRGD